MKRDMELIRRILLKIEETDSGELPENCFADVDPKLVSYHFCILDDAGFIMRTHERYFAILHGEGGLRPVAENLHDPIHTRVIKTSRGCTIIHPQLSWKGWEFLDSVRDDKVWRDVKKEISKVKAVPFEIVAALAVKCVSKLVGLD